MSHELLTTAEAAAYLRQSVSSLAKRRVYGSGPTFVKAGARIYYEKAALDAWVAARRHISTSEYETA